MVGVNILLLLYITINVIPDNIQQRPSLEQLLTSLNQQQVYNLTAWHKYLKRLFHMGFVFYSPNANLE